MKTYHFTHSGKLGDTIYAMATVRELAREHNCRIAVHLIPRPWDNWMLTEREANHLLPLLRALPYVASADYLPEMPKFPSQPFNPDAANQFRQLDWDGMNLAEAQLRCYALNRDAWREPWITVAMLGHVPAVSESAAVLVSRTFRYVIQDFPWVEIVGAYEEHELAFIGTAPEYYSLCNLWQYRIPYIRTRNLLDVAKVIQSSNLHISSQGANAAISDAMGHALILAHTGASCNFFPRPNKKHLGPKQLRRESDADRLKRVVWGVR